MRIHYFQHIPFENLAIIEDWIHEKGHTLTATRFYEEVWFPPVEEIDWLIIMGGFMGAYDEEEFPWLIREKDYIRQCANSNKLVLGICLGSQLIASALGAKVYRNKEKEIGWHEVEFTDQGKKHPLFDFIPDKFRFFQWHGDTFEIPEGAVRIAGNDACVNQGFIYNDRVIGLQFHPEATENSVKVLIDVCRDELVKAKYIQSEDEILRNIDLACENNKIMIGILERMELLGNVE